MAFKKIKPLSDNVKELLSRDTEVTWEEFQLASTDDEKQLLYPKLTNEALLRVVNLDILPRVNLSSYYSSILINQLVPILVRRLEEATKVIEVYEEALEDAHIYMDDEGYDWLADKFARLGVHW